MVSRLTTWTLSRDTDQGVMFPVVTYFDGQGFLVRKDMKVAGVAGLNGASICVTQGTTTEMNVAAYFGARKLAYKIVAYERNEEAVRAYDAGRCDALSSDRSATAAYRLQMKAPDQHMVLPETTSFEPLALAVADGDTRWYRVVFWAVKAMVRAEELGLSSANIDEKARGATGETARLLGSEGNLGKGLGLSATWASDVVKQVGNYGEVFTRNLGEGSPLKLERGMNKLASDGGLQFSPPFR
jgi:general L-amino acid transport system substrate-binding protein